MSFLHYHCYGIGSRSILKIKLDKNLLKVILKNLLVITSNFPNQAYPSYGTFVHQIAFAFVRQKLNVTVINPIRLNFRTITKKEPFYKRIVCKDSSSIEIFSPKYFSFSSKSLFGINTGVLSQLTFQKAVNRTIKKISQKPEIIYAHFLYPAGASASNISMALGIPSFIGVGESVNFDDEILWSIKPFGLTKARKDLENTTGLIVNSTLLEKKILGQFPKFRKKIIKLPNGVDLQKFGKFDKLNCRQQLKLPKDKFLVIFVGSFSHRKGVLRLLESIDKLAFDDIGVIYIGKGGLEPIGRNLVYKGQVNHDQLPKWLSAADVFALPTLGEGSSNAILEAMACGLPIVTSKGEFNDDIVDETNSIRVDPMNVDEIRNAILLLKNDEELRKKLSQGSLQKIQHFDIDKRAEKILKWMEGMIKKT